MRSRLMTILMVVVISIAGVGVLYAAGNEPLNSPAVRSSYTLQQANRQLPTDRAPLAAACVTGGAYNSACDVDHDGDVDIFDIQLAAGHWGQTGAYSAGAAAPCFDNANRYVDCGNGTVTDTVTGLIWLKNANCFGLQTYAAANTAAAGLQTGACGLTDNSTPGDWRLPTREEFEAILLSSCPTAPMIVGNGSPITGCYSDNSWATGVQSNVYWTSTTNANVTSYAWFVYLSVGFVDYGVKSITRYVWPVRGGQ